MYRMKRILYLLLFVLVFFSSYVFSESPVCSFAVISDLHLVDTDSIAMEKFEMVVEKIKGQNVDIIFITGDIILPADEAKFRKIISDAGVPVYITFGNNDFPSRNRLRKIFSDLAISDYYHFLYKNSLFICLCDAINDHVGHLESEYISPGQIEYLERGLSEYNRKVDHIFIFAHIPLSQDGSAGRMFISTNDQKFLREMIGQVLVAIVGVAVGVFVGVFLFSIYGVLPKISGGITNVVPKLK